MRGDICPIAKENRHRSVEGGAQRSKTPKVIFCSSCPALPSLRRHGTSTGAGKHADKATRHLIGPRGERKGKNGQEGRRERRMRVGYRILQVRFLIFFPGRMPPPEGLPLLRLFVGWVMYPSSSIAMTVSTALAKTSSTPRISLLLHST